MRKKIKPYIWNITFLILLIAPTVLYFFVGQYMKQENNENRKAARKPKFTVETLADYPSGYEAYYNDKLPFRNELIRMNSYFNFYMFHESPNSDVVIGKNGWLFYDSPTDGSAIQQALGKNMLDEEVLTLIADNLQESKEYLAKMGTEFVLYIAPNKETLYRDQLPNYYDISETYINTNQLIDYLKDNTDIRIIYTYDDLQQEKQNLEIPLYCHLDTHWNNIGGYIGTSILLKELGLNMPDLNELTLQERHTSEGDLTKMMNIPIPNGDTDYEILGYSNLTTKKEKTRIGDKFHTDGADKRKIFIYRDSYALAMMPYLSSQFEDSYFVHKLDFKQKMLKKQKPDIFVLELVERNVEDLMDFRLK